MPEQHVTIRSRDGLHLAGTLVRPNTPAGQAVVLVHGGGVTREEGGFFARLAAGLAQAGVASLRFDLRGHGESEGPLEDLTIAGILGDINAAIAHVAETSGARDLALVGTSFACGICAYYAARHPEQLRSLVLLNPLLNFKKRFIDDKPYGHHDQIDEDAGRELLASGYLAHSPTFKLGRALLPRRMRLDRVLQLPTAAGQRPSHPCRSELGAIGHRPRGAHLAERLNNKIRTPSIDRTATPRITARPASPHKDARRESPITIWTRDGVLELSF